MKNSKEIAQTVFAKRDQALAATQRRNKRIRAVTAGVSAVCVCFAVILAAKYLRPENGDIPAIHTEATKAAASTTAKATSALAESGTQETAKLTIASRSTQAAQTNRPTESTQTVPASDPTSAPQTTVKPAASQKAAPSTTKPSAPSTAPPTEPQTDVTELPKDHPTATESVIEPHWDERPINEQFGSFTLNGIEYLSRSREVAPESIGDVLGTVTMTGWDIYEEKTYTMQATAYQMQGFASDFAAAVQFDGYDGYYAYTNCFGYFPATFGEMVDAMDLTQELTFGTLYLDQNKFQTDTYNTAVLYALLTECRDAENHFDTSGTDAYFRHEPLFTVSATVDKLSICNKSFRITKDGYICTNLMEWGYSFYIGTQKAYEIAQELDLDAIRQEAATKPTDTLPEIPEESPAFEETME